MERKFGSMGLVMWVSGARDAPVGKVPSTTRTGTYSRENSKTIKPTGLASMSTKADKPTKVTGSMICKKVGGRRP